MSRYILPSSGLLPHSYHHHLSSGKYLIIAQIKSHSVVFKVNPLTSTEAALAMCAERGYKPLYAINVRMKLGALAQQAAQSRNSPHA